MIKIFQAMAATLIFCGNMKHGNTVAGERKLPAICGRCLRKIFGVTCMDGMTNEERYRRTNQLVLVDNPQTKRLMVWSYPSHGENESSTYNYALASNRTSGKREAASNMK